MSNSNMADIFEESPAPMNNSNSNRRNNSSRNASMNSANAPMNSANAPMNSVQSGGRRRTARKGSAVGSKAQVWHGNADHTSGGLHKSDLMKHKGRIISRKKHALGKKALKHLVKAGYKPKKGTFKLFKK
jgi:hypothetical protein